MIGNTKVQMSNFKKFLICHFNFVIYLLFVIWILSFLTISPVYAQEATTSSSVRSKLEELKKEIASKAAKLKLEVDRKLRDKAYIGSIKQKSETSITLASSRGPKIVSVNQDTEFVSNIKSKTKLTLNLLKEEDYIATLGDVDETGVLLAKRIVLLPTTNSKLKTQLWGQVMTLSEKLITLKLKDLKTISVSLPKEERVALNDYVITSGIVNENGVFEATFVYVIPQGGIIKLKTKYSSPSARSDESETRRATPKQTSTPKPASR